MPVDLSFLRITVENAEDAEITFGVSATSVSSVVIQTVRIGTINIALPGGPPFGLSLVAAIADNRGMKFTKNIGMLLLAIYLIVDGLLGFGLHLGPAIFLLYILAIAAGILILIGK
jgi:hypothetical protein